MSAGHPSDAYDGLLPERIEARLVAMMSRAMGFLVLATVVLVWLALTTWSVTDPSLTHATGGQTSNALGPAGAIISDLFIQMLGIGAIAVLLAPMLWGIDLVRSEHIAYFRAKAACYPLSILLLAGFFSSLPLTAGWPLHHGLGGILGDVVAELVRSIFAVVNAERASLAGALVLGATAVSLACRSIGIELTDVCSATVRSARWRASNGSWHENLAAEARHIAIRSGTQPAQAANDRRSMPDLTPSPAADLPADFDDGLETGEDAPPSRGRFASGLLARLTAAFPHRGADHGHAQSGSEDQDENEEQRLAPPTTSHARGHAPRWADDDSIAARFASNFDSLKTLRPGSRDEDNFDIAEATTDAPNDRSSYSIAARFAPFAGRRPLAEGPTQDIASGIPARARKTPAPSPAKSAQQTGPALPPLTLLKTSPAPRGSSEPIEPQHRSMAAQLLSVLADYGVRGEMRDIRPGPVVTLIEFEPVRGTKAARIIGLADDIARSMSMTSVRAAVVPGRNVIGFELPNPRRVPVLLRDVLESPSYQTSQAVLPLALGRAIGGEPVVVDLARMPHLLVAGTTGSGKSVGVNAMILSLIYRLPPDQCRFIMIDPKMLELSVYNGIPHLLTPVVTDPLKAVAALNWAVGEMEERYKRMASLSVRNIEAFNARIRTATSRGEDLVRMVQTGFDRETGKPRYERVEIDARPMPYIVIVVDEFADLMVVAGKEIEQAVQRLAQMARAAGIHLIMATQRPSVDIVTGTIKANFPTRIGFKVASKIDSRTILNEQGAEQLLGQGDMLYSSGAGLPTRVHGPFVSDSEVEEVSHYLARETEPDYVVGLTDDASQMVAGTMQAVRADRDDELYQRALHIVLQDRKASTSYVQRRLSIGYNKAADLIERMERDGYISPANSVGKREILRPAA